MKFSEIVNLDKSDLRRKVQKMQQDLFESRMKLKMQRLPNPLSLRLLRRDIARLQTAISTKNKEGK